MSRLDLVRAAIFQTLSTVLEIGKVHDRERYLREEQKFRALYIHTLPDGRLQLRGWWFRRTATEERSINIARTVNVDTWAVRGYMALDDDAGSELVFDGLIEAFRDAVRLDPTFGGVCTQGPLGDGDNTDGVQVVDTGPVTFCGVLCHSALLQLRTWSYL
ncbi:hypothetical protein [Variovorax paradoxus]|uniref:Uncharacterized protein n=1 Tax=Variovorax paradoxus TaxID=34073 RepID=A0A0H2MAC4_VARPD|nr:hypothetical protein [Variovorax paradoxus]KLN57622.1 hypothetical protein VPARA_11350 [Variovorax paradoxus]